VKQRNAFTIVELLVVVAIISLLIAILLPALGRARDAALITQSQGNLRNMAAANATYGADYSDRQFTASADDMGLASGCQDYIDNFGCMGQQILGWDNQGGLWGYWLGSGQLCPGNYPGNCGNWIVYWPCSFNFTGTEGGFGYYRMPNVKAFNNYVNGRFYDKTFIAPKDKLTLERAEEGMSYPGEFLPPPPAPAKPVVFSTYVWGPAQLWAPEVFGRRVTNIPAYPGGVPLQPSVNGPWPAAFKCPSQGQTKYSDLKSRMFEYYWLQNQDGGPTNPSFGGQQQWYYNQGNNSTPNVLFFDGHVGVAGVAQAMDDDRRLSRQQATAAFPQKGIWHRGVPGAAGNGFFQQYGFDMLANTSYMMFTVDGILGRDVLEAK
jgi:prepilin-type N-terminal cleavage/methylation domain-containing protein/prepilin-type processing-associated H-X9-DG protein